jgi:hypothetical protein
MKGWRLAISVCVFSLGLIFQANVAQASVEDLLYEKGQITKEEWIKLKAEHEREEATRSASGAMCKPAIPTFPEINRYGVSTITPFAIIPVLPSAASDSSFQGM